MKKYVIPFFLLLLAMAGLLFGSIRHETATYDESAHLAAGVGYVQEHKYYLNPEHPPFIKYLAGLSATWFGHAEFPVMAPAWQYGVNNQYELGDSLLYAQGSNAANLLWWGRFPLILLTLLFAGIFFLWAKKEYGLRTAFLALSFFVFSPTILAHGRYVTTDVAAAFGYFLSLIAFLSFLKKPTWLNLLWAGLALGLGLLTKFSLLLLLPLLILILVLWLVKNRKVDWPLVGKTVLVFLLSGITVWITYFGVMYREPIDRQLHDTAELLKVNPNQFENKVILKLTKYRATQPVAKYLTGVAMANQRVSEGAPVTLLGKKYPSGVPQYFPLLYLLKEPLAFHVLSLLGLGFALTVAFRQKKKMWSELHFASLALLTAVLVYWAVSIPSKLNIGIRHILPLLPLTYVLVASQVVKWWETAGSSTWRWAKTAFLGGMVVWLAASTVWAYPHFLSYYNELAGGSGNGYKVATDSNYDWGQDLQYLADYVRTQGIAKIGVDYFGKAPLRYYLGEAAEPWDANHPAYHGWFAMSASKYAEFLGTSKYTWLTSQTPVARAGATILIFHLP